MYREINERTSSRGSHKKAYPAEEAQAHSLGRRNSPDHMPLAYKTSSHGSSEQGTFKVGGLIKKTITVTIEGSDLHLISYYTSEDIRSGRLKRPSSRSDIMGLYMPPHIFRLTNFRVPPKVEIGPDGKPRLVCESAGEEAEPVDCKVEDEMYPMPASQTWTSNTVEQSFAGSSLYPVGSRWQAQSEANTNLRPEVTWPSSSSTLGSSHSGLRRREGNMGQEGWPSHHTQSQPSRWQDSAAATSGAGPGGLYLERSRARTSHHPYEETVVLPRREHEALPSFNRYSSSGSRENASHRVQWHHRDTHHGKERRMSPHSPSSFTSSPTLPFSPHATYHPSHFSSAWTSSDSHAMDTPTLHPISPSAYETSYTSPSLSSPEDFGNVEEFTEA